MNPQALMPKAGSSSFTAPPHPVHPTQAGFPQYTASRENGTDEFHINYLACLCHSDYSLQVIHLKFTVSTVPQTRCASFSNVKKLCLKSKSAAQAVLWRCRVRYWASTKFMRVLKSLRNLRFVMGVRGIEGRETLVVLKLSLQKGWLREWRDDPSSRKLLCL